MNMSQNVTEFGADALAEKARKHLWMHFTRHSSFNDGGHVPVIVKGEGAYIWDDQGRKYLDGLSGLFVVNAGHGRDEIADAMAKQAKELEYSRSGVTPTPRPLRWLSASPNVHLAT